MIDGSSITVICTEPNNGYYTMVFTDKGTLMRSQCSIGDMYEGLVHTVSNLLLHCVDNITPMPKVKEITPEAEAAVDRYVEGLQEALIGFMKSVQHQMCIDSTAHQLEATGLDKVFADMLAHGIHEFPGKFTPANDKEDDDDANIDIN